MRRGQVGTADGSSRPEGPNFQILPRGSINIYFFFMQLLITYTYIYMHVCIYIYLFIYMLCNMMLNIYAHYHYGIMPRQPQEAWPFWELTIVYVGPVG